MCQKRCSTKVNTAATLFNNAGYILKLLILNNSVAVNAKKTTQHASTKRDRWSPHINTVHTNCTTCLHANCIECTLVLLRQCVLGSLLMEAMHTHPCTYSGAAAIHAFTLTAHVVQVDVNRRHKVSPETKLLGTNA